MNLHSLAKLTDEELDELHFALSLKGDSVAGAFITDFKTFFGKHIVVTKGRKVPIGLQGIVTWMGNTCYSKYGDPWGIYTHTRVGIKDSFGNMHWTDIKNIALAEIVYKGYSGERVAY